MTRAELMAAIKAPYRQAGVDKIRAYAARMARLRDKKLTPREAIRLDVLKERTNADLVDLDLEIMPIFWKTPEDYNTGGVEFQHCVWRLGRLADEIEKLIEVEPSDLAKPYQRPIKRGWVYFIQAGDYVKIGYATDIKVRTKTLDTGSPFELVLLRQERGNMDDEARYHKQFAELRVRGEWFRHEGPLAAYIASGATK